MIELLEEQLNDEYKWICPEGIHYKSKKDFLQQEILGFCGCGNPDKVMEYVGDFLSNLNNQVWADYDNMPYMFLIYWADNKGYTEHGTSARCSWLTEKGKELLGDIEWCLKNELQ